jgi:hypothetical protein
MRNYKSAARSLTIGPAGYPKKAALEDLIFASFEIRDEAGR